MSIPSDLARITNAKAAIKAAIEGKGVTVPDDTMLDGMATLIESIEAGKNPFGRLYEVGSFVNAEDLNSLTNIQHNLNTVPTGIIYWTEEDAYADTARGWAVAGWQFIFSVDDLTDVNTKDVTGFCTSIYKSSGATNTVRLYPAYSTKTAKYNLYGTQTSVSHTVAAILRKATAEKFDIFTPSTSAYFPAGVLYKYVLIGDSI